MGFRKGWNGDRAGAEDTSAGEFSWDPGPVPPGCEYRPKTPSMVDPPRRARRSEVRGNPGDIVAQSNVVGLVTPQCPARPKSARWRVAILAGRAPPPAAQSTPDVGHDVDPVRGVRLLAGSSPG